MFIVANIFGQSLSIHIDLCNEPLPEGNELHSWMVEGEVCLLWLIYLAKVSPYILIYAT